MAISTLIWANLLLIDAQFRFFSVASAKNIYVSPTGSDSNSGTQLSPLKSINYAVSSSQKGDVILLEQGTFTETTTISLEHKVLSFATASSQQDVIITVPSTGNSSIFFISNSVVTLDLLTLNGVGGTESCVNVNGGAVTMTSLLVHDCLAATSNGGAVYSIEANVSIKGSTFTGNRAYGGAGIYAYLTPLSVSNSTFTNNAAIEGGAIYLDGFSDLYLGTGTINNCTFDSNTALGNGAGVYVALFTKTVAVERSTFTRNKAVNYGGAIYTISDATDNVYGLLTFECNYAGTQAPDLASFETVGSRSCSSCTYLNCQPTKF